MTTMESFKVLKDRGYTDHCLWRVSDKCWGYCKIRDCREVFGRVDLLVSPVNGEGEKWVQIDSCKPLCINKFGKE